MSNLFTSLIFYGQLIGTVLIYRRWIGRCTPAIRRLFLIGTSVFFLNQTLFGYQILLATSLYAVALYLTGRMVQSWSGPWRLTLIYVALFLILGTLAVFKYPAISQMIAELSGRHGLPLFAWVGLSYMTFRGLDFFVDVCHQRNKNYSFWTVASFLFFFPSFVSGPINSYGRFVSDTERDLPEIHLDQMVLHALRIAVGIIKLLWLAPLVHMFSTLDKGNVGVYADFGLGSGQLIVTLYAHLLYIYLDFSGYCDIAISAAALFGITLPENFNWPIFSANPQDFWNRWHISLSHWCRTHVFFPLTKWLATAQKGVRPLFCSMIAIFLTFCLVGVWHGQGFNWFLYGALHGAMLAGHMYYRSVMNRYWPDFYAKLQEVWLYKISCNVLTVSYVALGLLLIRPLPEMKAMLNW